MNDQLWYIKVIDFPMFIDCMLLFTERWAVLDVWDFLGGHQVGQSTLRGGKMVCLVFNEHTLRCVLNLNHVLTGWEWYYTCMYTSKFAKCEINMKIFTWNSLYAHFMGTFSWISHVMILSVYFFIQKIEKRHIGNDIKIMLS